MWWIIALVAAGVGLAILIGVLGTRNEPSKTEAASSLCSSLQGLESSVKSLTSLPSGSSKSDYQSSVNGVKNAWSEVQSDAQDVKNAPTGDLDNAWNDFTSAVKNVPDSDSASDAVNSVTQSAQALASAAQTTASQVNCSSSSGSS
jgi:hypothetical protein